MKHVWYKCPQPCTEVNCRFCDGGLALCTICRCTEGSLPTDCPGAEVSMKTQDAIYAGVLDYKNGAWISLKNVIKKK